MRTARTARALAWAGFGLLATFGLVAPLAGFGPKAMMVWVSGWVYLLPMFLAATGAAVLSVRYARTVERDFWGLLSLACGFLLVAELYWTYYTAVVDASGPPISSWSQWVNLLAALSFCFLLVTMTDLRRRPFPVQLRVYFDALAAMCIAYALVYVTWTLPLFSDLPDGATAAAWAAAWPVLGATMVSIMLAVMVSQKATRWRSWERMVVVSVTVFALGLLSFPSYYHTVVESSALGSDWYVAVLGAGMYLLFVAVVYRATAAPTEGLGELWSLSRASATAPRRLYPVIMALALPALAYVTMHLDADVHSPLEGATALLAVLLVARSWLVEFENAQEQRRITIDPQTGLFSERFLQQRLRELSEESLSSATPLSLAVIRIDDLRRLDALHGRDVEDTLVTSLSRVLSQRFTTRAEAFRSRFDEFAVVFPEIEAAEAGRLMAERIIAFESSPVLPAAVAASASAGVAAADEPGWDAGDLLTRARMACDRARDSEFEAVHLFSEQDVQGSGHQPRADVLAPRWSLGVVRTLAAAADGRDARAASHSARVAALAENLAQSARFEADEIERVRVAASVHDVGKLGVSREVLSSSHPWNAEQRAEFELHAELGARILHAVGLGRYENAVRHHHEAWDGTGYPGGLRGQSIPLESRVLAICDTFEALTAGRVTGTPLDAGAALGRIRAEAGVRFDPALTQVFADSVSAEPAVEPAP